MHSEDLATWYVTAQSAANSHGDPSTNAQDAATRTAPFLHAFPFTLLHLRNIPHLPELQILVASPSAHDVPVRAQSTPEHPCIMRISNFAYTLQAGVSVDHEGVRREPVSREELFAMRRPLNGCHLGWCRQRMQPRACGGIPDVHGGVVGASAGCEKGGLPRTPGDRLRRHREVISNRARQGKATMNLP